MEEREKENNEKKGNDRNTRGSNAALKKKETALEKAERMKNENDEKEL